MRGFSGYVKRSEPIEPVRASVAVVDERIAHRGPDDHATRSTSRAQIEFRRLSIMDAAHGRQPFRTREERRPRFVNARRSGLTDIVQLVLDPPFSRGLPSIDEVARSIEDRAA